ncbi:MAG: 30S ribosomal protein S20 [Minisyncoccia bacterium]
MAITKGAKKAIRQGDRKRGMNLRRQKVMKETVKEVSKLVSANKKAEAQKGLSAAFKALDKAAKRGVIKKNTASRKKSRLAKAIAKIK